MSPRIILVNIVKVITNTTYLLKRVTYKSPKAYHPSMLNNKQHTPTRYMIAS